MPTYSAFDGNSQDKQKSYLISTQRLLTGPRQLNKILYGVYTRPQYHWWFIKVLSKMESIASDKTCIKQPYRVIFSSKLNDAEMSDSHLEPLSWCRHQMETFSALLALCAGNSPITGEFPSQRPVTQSFDVFSDLRLNKRLSKQTLGWWFGTPSCPLWCQCNDAYI